MHEQMERLYMAAKKLKRLEGQSAVAHALNISPQRVNNWEARGMSQQGMLSAQAIFGCSATWLDTGEGEMAAPGGTKGAAFFDSIEPHEVDLLTMYRLANEIERQVFEAAANNVRDRLLADVRSKRG